MKQQIEFKENNILTRDEFSLVKKSFDNDKSVIIVYKCKLIEFFWYLLGAGLGSEKCKNLYNLIYLNHYIPTYTNSLIYTNSNKIVDLKAFDKFFGQFLGREVLVEFRAHKPFLEFLTKIIKLPKYYKQTYDFSWGYESNELGFTNSLINPNDSWFNIRCIDAELKFRLPFILNYSGELPGCDFGYIKLNLSKYYNRDTNTFTEPALLKMFMGINMIPNYPLFFPYNDELKEYLSTYKYFSKNNIIELSQNIRDRIYLRVDNKIYSYKELYHKLSDIEILCLK